MDYKTHILFTSFVAGQMFLSRIGGGQKKCGSNVPIELIVGSVKIEAYHFFQNFIPAVDFNICACGEQSYFDISKSELPVKQTDSTFLILF